MELNKAIEVLTTHQKWRRGDERLTQTDPKELGIAIDTILNHLKSEQTMTVGIENTTLGKE